jgi:hypothetical protein
MEPEPRPQWLTKLSSNRRAALSVALVATFVIVVRALSHWLRW